MKKILSGLILAAAVLLLPASVAKAGETGANSIKIGIVDSGVDYIDGVYVEKSKNFVDKYAEKSYFFSDLSGHGTAVASVMVSDTGRVRGINTDARLYSAEVLDEDSTATVDRLVEGIEWLIREDVNIINISCGLHEDSEKLHAVIKKAYSRGILLIAAAGEGREVSYPAAYVEVMAVGAVGKDGDLMENSPSGPEIEVVAPGEDILTYGSFGTLNRISGTSIAAPQVSALASLLWQQDPDKPAGFIRQLIDRSAQPLIASDTGLCGVADKQRAFAMFEDFSNTYTENDNAVRSTYDEKALHQTDIRRVKGFWTLFTHESVITYNKGALKAGAVWPDSVESGIQGMDAHPQFHGLYTANYVDSCITITKFAASMRKHGKFPKADNSFEKKIVKAAQRGFRQYRLSGKDSKGLFVYGMAIHTATDVFAHSSVGVPGKNRNALKKFNVKKLVKKWSRLKHGKRDPSTGGFFEATNMADDNNCVVKRFRNAAKKVCYWLIKKAVIRKKAATMDMFSNVKAYKRVSEIEKYGNSSCEIKKKKQYLINGFGVLKLNVYLKSAKNSKVKSVAENLSNSNIERVIKEWAKN